MALRWIVVRGQGTYCSGIPATKYIERTQTDGAVGAALDAVEGLTKKESIRLALLILSVYGNIHRQQKVYCHDFQPKPKWRWFSTTICFDGERVNLKASKEWI